MANAENTLQLYSGKCIEGDTIGAILIAKVIPGILELLEVSLQFKGYPVITAHNGLQALERAKTEHPALVITDILMPKLDVYQPTQRLRTNPKTSL